MDISGKPVQYIDDTAIYLVEEGHLLRGLMLAQITRVDRLWYTYPTWTKRSLMIERFVPMYLAARPSWQSSAAENVGLRSSNVKDRDPRNRPLSFGLEYKFEMTSRRGPWGIDLFNRFSTDVSTIPERLRGLTWSPGAHFAPEDREPSSQALCKHPSWVLYEA